MPPGPGSLAGLPERARPPQGARSPGREGRNAMNVEQLMTKEAKTVRRDETLSEAARIMWENDVGCAPVVDSDGSYRVIGIVTDRDICMAAYTQGKPLHDLPVSTAMSSAVLTCRGDDTIAHAAEIMRENHIRRLPVVDEAGQLLGVISLTDIAREAAAERRKRSKKVTDAEVGLTLSAICEPRLPATIE